MGTAPKQIGNVLQPQWMILSKEEHKKLLDSVTEEELDILQREKPELLKLINEGHIIAGAWLSNFRLKRENKEKPSSIISEPIEQYRKVQDSIQKNIKRNPEQGELLYRWCGYASALTKCSPFFPMRNNSLEKRDYISNMLITSANWGEISYTGPRLSIYDEDILLALLYIVESSPINKYEKYNKKQIIKQDCPTELKIERTYIYKGPMSVILKVLGYEKPCAKEYKRLIDSLERMVFAGFKLSVSSGKTRSGARKEPQKIHISTIIEGTFIDNDTKEITVVLNPFFYEMYVSGRFSWIDVNTRIVLKSQISKAIYRFLRGQRDGYNGHFINLADSLNIDLKKPKYEIRRLLKTSIKEMIDKKILTPSSGFVKEKSDIIKLTLTISERNNG